MESKYTAVEWLVNELENHHVFHDIKNTVAYQQAKEMEKQEIIETFKYAQILHAMNDQMRGEQYYNETYGK